MKKTTKKDCSFGLWKSFTWMECSSKHWKEEKKWDMGKNIPEKKIPEVFEEKGSQWEWSRWLGVRVIMGGSRQWGALFSSPLSGCDTIQNKVLKQSSSCSLRIYLSCHWITESYSLEYRGTGSQKARQEMLQLPRREIRLDQTQQWGWWEMVGKFISKAKYNILTGLGVQTPRSPPPKKDRIY